MIDCIDCPEPPRKRLCSDSSTATDTTDNDNTSSANSSTKIWEWFTEVLQEVGVTKDTTGGVKDKVDRYLSELLIEQKSMMNKEAN